MSGRSGASFQLAEKVGGAATAGGLAVAGVAGGLYASNAVGNGYRGWLVFGIAIAILGFTVFLFGAVGQFVQQRRLEAAQAAPVPSNSAAASAPQPTHSRFTKNEALCERLHALYEEGVALRDAARPGSTVTRRDVENWEANVDVAIASHALLTQQFAVGRDPGHSIGVLSGDQHPQWIRLAQAVKALERVIDANKCAAVPPDPQEWPAGSRPEPACTNLEALIGRGERIRDHSDNAEWNDTHVLTDEIFAWNRAVMREFDGQPRHLLGFTRLSNKQPAGCKPTDKPFIVLLDNALFNLKETTRTTLCR